MRHGLDSGHLPTATCTWRVTVGGSRRWLLAVLLMIFPAAICYSCMLHMGTFYSTRFTSNQLLR